MPPKKLPLKASQQKPQTRTPQTTPIQAHNASPISTPTSTLAIPERDMKKSSSVSAQLALEVAKKAYEVRQVAYGAADPNAREEILATAINKEIEAESFGKAAKYSRLGAFRGLIAGAGLGV
ncbi:uncharacterized protein PV07_09976 [Cladophialophora immunda]|uniref:Uncharacterized protein n=1 Tax=Cladophialophora immunda TaxID=569365 RepID=A0A0D2BYM2_9EURO|nr:uncharacterized protein PV07_09976 [Cladophialophora immunda]KIW24248.1 hypothetical protein PV07_09976 [Cladophialophora immunda]OQV09579.1 hypothetical protein CLAIMM_13687 [Cladophialophora immunda]